MKIIGVDNLNRDYISDVLWIDNIPSECETFAQRVCDRLNRGLGDNSGTYYKIAADDRKLYIFEGY